MKKEYKSPTHKLLNFFEDSRDGWKERAKIRQDINRDLEAKVRDLKKSRDSWKAKTKEQKISNQNAHAEIFQDLQNARQKISGLEKELSELKKKTP
mgnify:CR=1 FL=1